MNTIPLTARWRLFFADRIYTHKALDSTSLWLSRRKPQQPTVCMTEVQSGGLGRRGKNWHSPAGNIYLSLSFPFETGNIGCLSLVAALAVHSVIRRLVRMPHCIKWPNDVLIAGKKCAGILLQLEKWHDRQYVIIGLGVNSCSVPKQFCSTATCLADAGSTVDNKTLAAVMIDRIMYNIFLFRRRGFSFFRSLWLARDCWYNHMIQVRSNNAVIEGKHVGIDDSGRLLVDNGTQRIACNSGEVSIREYSCILK